ncbi:MAG: glycosyltransferase, partial [Pseudomonadota bacterium]
MSTAFEFANTKFESSVGERTSPTNDADGAALPGTGRKVLIIVENLPVPFDRRVWEEATALREAGYGVSVICPKGKGFDKSFEVIDGINIYRHILFEASSTVGYLGEYLWALTCEFWLSFKVLRKHGFDIVHACNPPDLIFLVGGFFKLFFRKRFLFDHHDINPELYVAKFGRRDIFHWLLSLFERATFATADVSLATNEPFKQIAMQRGKMRDEDVFIVRSTPNLERMYRVEPDQALFNGRKHVIGYIGIMGSQDGIDLLLEAMRHMVFDRKITDAQCVIVGDGPEFDNLTTMSRELGLEDYVTFTGFLGGDKLLAALSSFTVGVIPDPANDYNRKISMNKNFEYMA